MIRLLLNVMMMLTVMFVAALFVAKLLGALQTPTPLLAYLSDRDRVTGANDIFVLDVAHHLVLNVTHSLRESATGSQTFNRSGDLAFSSYDGVASEIYVWRNNGELINISQNVAGFHMMPAWSNDGRLAFINSNDTGTEVVVWDNGVITPLRANSDLSESPVWSADGRLAFVSVADSGGREVNVWDGQTLTTVASVLLANQLAWNEAGQLTYVALVNNKWGVYLWDGTRRVSILQTNNGELMAAWSLDGQLVFNVYVYSDNRREVYLWHEATSTNISPPSGDAYVYPSGWSSDERLTFLSNATGNFDVYLWDGESLSNISNSSAYDGNPVWADNGWLAFESNRDGNSEIYIWDGATVRNFSRNSANDFAPVWWIPSP